MSASEETDPTQVGWTRRLLCFVCAKDGKNVKSTIRVFSGIGAGGFAACDEHRSIAEKMAIEPLGDPRISEDYTVTAYAMETREDGSPKMGRLLWRARPKKVSTRL